MTSPIKSAPLPVTLDETEKWRVAVDLDYIHELRIALNLSSAELALKSGINPATLSQIGRNNNCTLATIAKLATFLQVQPGELIIWYPVPKDVPDVIPRRGQYG